MVMGWSSVIAQTPYPTSLDLQRRENLALLPSRATEPDFPAFTLSPTSATICPMFKLGILFEFMTELVRTLLVGESVERARSLRVSRRLRGMKQVRRHVHRQCRRRLFDKIGR